ncbi:MAG: hypothetical protein QOF14_3678 [Hyphomicrobiales bacterium]|nr:hypothetical protein [Hyphomicrobiales bacterium]
MRMRSVFAAAILLAVSSGAALAQAGGDCCTLPGQGKDNDNNPSVWGVTPEAGNAFGSSNVHHPDMMPDNSSMATAPVSGTPGRYVRRDRATRPGYASR